MSIKDCLSIIIPTYNEGFNLLKLINKINFYNSLYYKGQIEILIVDDTENFSVKNIVRECLNTRYIRNRKKGLLNSIYNGFLQSRYDLVSFMDADLSHDPYYLFKNIKFIKTYHLLNFSRFLKKGNDQRKFQMSGPLKFYSKIINFICKYFISDKVSDFTCGYSIFNKSKINKNFFKGNYGEFYIYFLSKCLEKKLKIKEFNIIFKDRQLGESKTGTTNFSIIKRGIKYLYVILMIKLNVKL